LTFAQSTCTEFIPIWEFFYRQKGITIIPMTATMQFDSSSLSGMNDLLRRLDDIEVKCLGKSTERDAPADTKDKFLSMKSSMTRELADMKGKIMERREIMNACGTNHEVIQLTSQIRVLELKLKEDLIQLKDMYRKQCDGSLYAYWDGKCAKLNATEMAKRYESMDKLASQMEEARKAFRTGQSLNADSGDAEANNLRSQLISDPSSSGGGSMMRRSFRDGELDEEEKDAMNKWSEREQKLDEELIQVSVAVDRLKPLAEEIQATGRKQEKLISMINARVDKATGNLRSLNVRMKKFIDTNNKSTFVFRLVLIIVLLGLAAYIYLKYSGVSRVG
jgi:hypothetical protein